MVGASALFGKKAARQGRPAKSRAKRPKPPKAGPKRPDGAPRPLSGETLFAALSAKKRQAGPFPPKVYHFPLLCASAPQKSIFKNSPFVFGAQASLRHGSIAARSAHPPSTQYPPDAHEKPAAAGRAGLRNVLCSKFDRRQRQKQGESARTTLRFWRGRRGRSAKSACAARGARAP